jgi:hypothetical protein
MLILQVIADVAPVSSADDKTEVAEYSKLVRYR